MSENKRFGTISYYRDTDEVLLMSVSKINCSFKSDTFFFKESSRNGYIQSKILFSPFFHVFSYCSFIVSLVFKAVITTTLLKLKSFFVKKYN